MRKTYFRLFPTALALLLILTGCEKGIDKKTVWDSITKISPASIKSQQSATPAVTGSWIWMETEWLIPT